MLFGTAKRVITPTWPIRLSGYVSRTTPFEDIKEDIYLRIHVHRMRQAQLIFIYGDLIWWNTEFVDKARERLKRILGLAPDALFFLASHNHSGPPTGNTFVSQLEHGDEAYTEYLLEQVTGAVSEALTHLDEVTVWRFDGLSDLNVYRRVKTESGIKMRPNYEVEANRELTLLGFMGVEGNLKGLVVHYACHANISGENVVQPDYPGIVLRLLDEAYPAGVSMFWQGCTGDLRPYHVIGRNFAAGDYEKARQFAKDFYEDCQRTLSQPGTKLSEQAEIRKCEVKLPLENRKHDVQLCGDLHSNDNLCREWAGKVIQKENRDTETLRLKYLRYGDGLSVYFFGAEMSQEYALFARTYDPAALCTAYADGMIGYLCTANQIAEGGYEPEGSARYFALSGTFTPAIETMIKNEMVSIGGE